MHPHFSRETLNLITSFVFIHHAQVKEKKSPVLISFSSKHWKTVTYPDKSSSYNPCFDKLSRVGFHLKNYHNESTFYEAFFSIL